MHRKISGRIEIKLITMVTSRMQGGSRNGRNRRVRGSLVLSIMLTFFARRMYLCVII